MTDNYQYNPVAVHKGPNYVFYFNDGTGLGDLHVMQYQIPLQPPESTLFAASDEPTRQPLLKRFVEAYEARVKARKAAAGAR